MELYEKHYRCVEVNPSYSAEKPFTYTKFFYTKSTSSPTTNNLKNLTNNWHFTQQKTAIKLLAVTGVKFEYLSKERYKSIFLYRISLMKVNGFF